MGKKNFKSNITEGIDNLIKSTTIEKPAKKEEFVRYNYVIEKETYKKLKFLSIEEERPIINILQDALKLYFDNTANK